ncbi:MAG: dipeptidase PepE [Planctomycetota bacterium]|nr:MAG: dipeptidase PepE [Planctomycetota bacterium]
MRLLLLSTSTVHGTNYLDYAQAHVRAFLGAGVKRVLFVPFALHDRAAYAAKARERFERLGYGLDSLHEAAEQGRAAALAAIHGAEAVFTGGGNTFRLLEALQRLELLAPLRARAQAGMPYMGASAGSNLACPTLMTTNDMPIVQPQSFEALGLVPFQINPHYLDPEPGSKHMGETREQRIREYHEMNERTVVGLREGGILQRDGDRLKLIGQSGARVFRRGVEPVEFRPGDDLSALLQPASC